MERTIYHFYIEALTNTPYEPNRPVRKLSLYPRLTTLKELEELWEEVKKETVVGKTLI